MKLNDLEKKIFISGLGIIVLILIFYYIHERSKIREGAHVSIPIIGVPIPFSDIPSLLPSSITDFIKSIIDSVKNSIGFASNQATTVAKAVAAEAKGAARFAAKNAIDLSTKLQARATAVASHAKTAIRQKSIAFQQKMHDRKMKLKEKIMDKKKELEKEFNEKMSKLKTYRRVFKVGLVLSLIFKKLTRWALITTKIIIIRISNLKSCFIWYALEIIGWILYLPIELVVWFFCLQPMEQSFWAIVDSFDCFFNGIMGFHIFHYSDYVLHKCFIPQLPPFPYTSAGGLFTKDGLKKQMKDMVTPPDPREMAIYVKHGLDKYKQELLATFTKPPSFDVKQIWEEAMSLIKIDNPNNIDEEGEVPNDDSDTAINDANQSIDATEIPIPGGTSLSDKDMEVELKPIDVPIE